VWSRRGSDSGRRKGDDDFKVVVTEELEATDEQRDDGLKTVVIEDADGDRLFRPVGAGFDQPGVSTPGAATTYAISPGGPACQSLTSPISSSA